MSDDDGCCVCGSGISEESDVIVLCEGCNCAVHQHCYGISAVPVDSWFCEVCMDYIRNAPVGRSAKFLEDGGVVLANGQSESLRNKLTAHHHSIRCEACPASSMAMRRTEDDKWIHAACAFWHPELKFVDQIVFNRARSFEHVSSQRKSLQCQICHSTQGACIHCDHSGCKQTFHVQCGRQDKRFLLAFTDAGIRAYCRNHSNNYRTDPLMLGMTVSSAASPPSSTRKGAKRSAASSPSRSAAPQSTSTPRSGSKPPRPSALSPVRESDNSGRRRSLNFESNAAAEPEPVRSTRSSTVATSKPTVSASAQPLVFTSFLADSASVAANADVLSSLTASLGAAGPAPSVSGPSGAIPPLVAQRKLYWQWISSSFAAPSAEQWSLLQTSAEQNDPAFVIPEIDPEIGVQTDREHPMFSLIATVHNAAPLPSTEQLPLVSHVVADPDPAMELLNSDSHVSDSAVLAACDGNVLFDARWIKEAKSAEFCLSLVQSQAVFPSASTVKFSAGSNRTKSRLALEHDPFYHEAGNDAVEIDVERTADLAFMLSPAEFDRQQQWRTLQPVSIVRYSDDPSRLRQASSYEAQTLNSAASNATLTLRQPRVFDASSVWTCTQPDILPMQAAELAALPRMDLSLRENAKSEVASPARKRGKSTKNDLSAGLNSNADRDALDEVCAELLQLQRLLFVQKRANDRIRAQLRRRARLDFAARRQTLHASGLPFDDDQIREMEQQYNSIVLKERARRREERKARQAAGLTDSSSSSSSDEAASDPESDDENRAEAQQALLAALAGDADVDVDIVRRLCAICLEKGNGADNPVRVCTSCGVACHIDCYSGCGGSRHEDSAGWKCEVCRVGDSSSLARCVVCKRSGGPMKATAESYDIVTGDIIPAVVRWCHVVCAIYVPYLSFDVGEQLERIAGVASIPRAFYTLTCSLCGKKGLGACVQCGESRCCIAFHPSCALEAGLDSTDHVDSHGATQFNIYCDRHRRQPRSKAVEKYVQYWRAVRRHMDAQRRQRIRERIAQPKQRATSSAVVDTDGFTRYLDSEGLSEEEEDDVCVSPSKRGRRSQPQPPALPVALRRPDDDTLLSRYLESSASSCSAEDRVVGQWSRARLSELKECFGCNEDQPSTAEWRAVEKFDTSDLDLCAICFSDETQDDNTLVFCTTCGLVVHQACYGIETVPDDDWFCVRCISVNNGNAAVKEQLEHAPCAVCPRTDGAVHAVAKTASAGLSSPFVHAICVQLIPALYYVDNSPPSAPLTVKSVNASTEIGCVAGFNLIPKGLQKLVCVLCGVKNGTTCAQCRVNSCAVAFHPSCARQAGWDVSVFETNGAATWKGFCHRHRQERMTIEVAAHVLKRERVVLDRLLLDAQVDWEERHRDALEAHREKETEFESRLLEWQQRQGDKRRGRRRGRSDRPCAITVRMPDPPSGVCCVCMYPARPSAEAAACDPLLICRSCSVSVHSQCYGDVGICSDDEDASVEDKPFCCTLCRLRVRNVPCSLCPARGGALKPLMEEAVVDVDTVGLSVPRAEFGPVKRFAHLLCMLAQPETFLPPSAPGRIAGADAAIKSWRAKSVCQLCCGHLASESSIVRGVVVPCAENGCSVKVHITCARAAAWPVLDMQRSDVVFVTFCPAHADAGVHAAQVLGTVLPPSFGTLFDFRPPVIAAPPISAAVKQKTLQTMLAAIRSSSNSQVLYTSLVALARKARIDVDLNQTESCAVCCTMAPTADQRSLISNSQLLQCTSCRVRVHSACFAFRQSEYRVAADTQWQCEPCRANASEPSSIKCAACFSSGGIMRHTELRDTWCHIDCALLSPFLVVGPLSSKPITRHSVADESELCVIGLAVAMETEHVCAICSGSGRFMSTCNAECQVRAHAKCILMQNSIVSNWCCPAHNGVAIRASCSADQPNIIHLQHGRSLRSSFESALLSSIQPAPQPAPQFAALRSPSSRAARIELSPPRHAHGDSSSLRQQKRRSYVISSDEGTDADDDDFESKKRHHKRHRSALSPLGGSRRVAAAAVEPTTVVDPDEQLYCICRQPHSPTGPPMIGCDSCEEWYHGTCLGINVSDYEGDDTWICPRCVARRHKREQKMSPVKKAQSTPTSAKRWTIKSSLSPTVIKLGAVAADVVDVEMTDSEPAQSPMRVTRSRSMTATPAKEIVTLSSVPTSPKQRAVSPKPPPPAKTDTKPQSKPAAGTLMAFWGRK